ncbi:fumarylacetoacetate hydrolase family protein [Chloroflexota bacterium]
MYTVRFSIHGRAKYGVLEGEVVRGFKGSPFAQPGGKTSSFVPDGSTYRLSEVNLLAPCLPSKIVGLGLNYRELAESVNVPIPQVPLIFLKPPTAVIGPEENIVLPRNSGVVEFEGELGVVIGKKAEDVPQDKASEYIFGYTCINDLTDRKQQKEDGQWTRAKGYDTFAPIGPCISTGISGDNLKIETYIDGELLQSFRTSDLIFGIPKLISFVSDVMTLLPGDIIATGTAIGAGELKNGDIIEIIIENVGTLKNYVVSQS